MKIIMEEKILIPSWEMGDKKLSEFDFERYLKEIDNLRMNIGTLLFWSLYLERYLEQLLVMLLNPEVYDSHDLKNFFDSKCVPFNTKIELLRNIRKDHKYINEEICQKITTLITKLKKMGEIRNAFAHGSFWFKADENTFYLKYWFGNKAKTDLLTEKYLNDIEVLIYDIEDMCIEIIHSLPKEAQKYYDLSMIL